MVGNRSVARLIQARQLTPDGKIAGRQGRATIGAGVLDTTGSRSPRHPIAIQRDDRKSKKSRASRPAWKDIRTVPQDELEQELKAVQDELFTTSMKTKRGKELFESMQMLKKEVARRNRAPRIAAVRRDLDWLAERQEGVVNAARFTFTLANEHILGPFERDLNEYVANFQKAFDKVNAKLREAEADEQRFQKIRDALIGVAIGTGVGLTAGAIWKSAEGLKQIVIEVGGEITEWIIAQGVNQIVAGPSKWEIPKSMEPSVQALAQTTKLLDAWKGVALMQNASTDVVQIMQVIRAQRGRLETEEGEMVLADTERRTESLKAKNAWKAMIEKIIEARYALHAFRSASEYGINRGEWVLTQDIWIAWIKSLGPSPGGDRNFHEAIRDVWDELEEAGVVDRLGLKAGRGGGLSEAPDAAIRDEQALKYMDKLAVVVAPAGQRSYIVRLRHDAYTGAALERDPDPGGPEPYLRAWSTTGQSFASGEVVKVHDVHQGQVEIFSTAWGTRTVSASETGYATGMVASRQ